MKSLKKLILAVNIISVIICVCAIITLFRPEWLAELALETYQNLTSELVEVPLSVVSNKLCRVACWIVVVSCFLNIIGAIILRCAGDLKDNEIIIVNGEAVSESAESVKEVSTVMKSRKERKHLNIFGKKKEKVVEVVEAPKAEAVVEKKAEDNNVAAFLKSIGGK